LSDIIINDNDQTITCRICGENHVRLYGKHFQYKHPGMTGKKYKEMFPGAPIRTEKDRIAGSKSSGKHMKQEKYKKMFSEMFGGENNPNHVSNTTEQERKERSPSCIEFYEKRYPDLTDIERKVMLSEHTKDKVKDRILPSNIEYWLERGYNEEESKKLVTERQTTFSKDICIEKYGEVEGIKIFNERQEKWRVSLNEGGALKIGYSSVSQELFEMIQNEIDGEFIYATNGGEFKLKRERGGIWMYDFTDLNRKKIIEYQGDLFHGNPKIYEANDHPHPFRKEKTAKEIWDLDEKKKRCAETMGYDVLYVWDSEYRSNEFQVLKKCIDFILC